MYMWNLGSSVLCDINAPYAQMSLCSKGREVTTTLASNTMTTFITVITVSLLSLLCTDMRAKGRGLRL